MLSGGHVAELNSLSAPFLVHNRAYIPQDGQTLQFDFASQAPELGRKALGQNTVRIPEIKVFVKVGNQEYELGPATISTPSDLQSGFLRANVPLIAKLNPLDPQSPSLDLHGRTESLIFRISLPGAAPTQVLSPARIQLDNVKLRLPGAPIVAGTVTESSTGSVSQVMTTDAGSVLAAAIAQWTQSGSLLAGSRVVELPNGIVGHAAGIIMSSTPDLTLNHVATSWQVNGSQQSGDTTGSEGSLNNQLFFININSGNEEIAVNKLRIDGEAALTSDGHTVQAQPDAGLPIIEGTSPVASVEEEHVAIEANVDPHGSFVNWLPIGVSNINVGLESAAPGSERPITQCDVFNLEEVPFEPP